MSFLRLPHLLSSALLLFLSCQEVLAANDPKDPVHCPPGYTRSEIDDDDYCFKYFAQSETFDDARDVCQREDGDLARWEDDKATRELIYSLCRGPNNQCWIGMRRAAGGFEWINDNTQPNEDASSWSSTYPKDNGEDCVMLWNGDEPRLTHVNEDCSKKHHFVCRLPVGCLPGYKLSTSGDKCIECDLGEYAPTISSSTSCIECPPGRFGSAKELKSSQCSGACEKGYYCPRGSTSSTEEKCPAGRYGKDRGLQTQQCSGACQPGYYCETGETSASPSGKKCEAGRYGGQGETSSACAGDCEAGYLCPPGSSSPQQQTCGDETKYCPAGQSEAEIVESGFYTFPEEGNTRTEQRKCPRGYYCHNGIRSKCLPGHFGAEEGMTSDTCSGECKEGFRCPAGSVDSTQISCGKGEEVPAAFYCPRGSSEPIRVSSGYYTIPENAPADQREDQRKCSIEYVCTSGERARKIEFFPSKSGASLSNTKLCEDQVGDNEFQGGHVSVSENTHEGNPFTNIVVKSRAGDISFSLGQQLDPQGPDPVGTCSLTQPFDSSMEKKTNDESKVSIKVDGTQDLDFENCPQYLVTLEASTDDAPSVTCQFTVQVASENDPPVFPESALIRDISEAASLNDPVGAPVVAENKEVGQEVRYEIVKALEGDASLFSIGACSGQITVNALGLDAAQRKEHRLEIKAEDDGNPPLDALKEVVINVIDSPQPPYFLKEQYTFDIDEDASVGDNVNGDNTGVVGVEDPDEGDVISYSITLLEGDGGDNPFSISSDGRIFFDRPGHGLDFVRASRYRVEVTASDGMFDVSISSVVINVNKVRQPPRVQLPPAAADPGNTPFTVDERSSEGTKVGPAFRIYDRDEAEVTINCEIVDPDGIFKVVDAAEDTYQLEVATNDADDLNHKNSTHLNLIMECQAADNSANPVSTTDFVVDLQHVNTAPQISPATFYVYEDASAGTLVGPGSAFNLYNRDAYVGQSVFFELREEENTADVTELFSVDLFSGDVTIRSNNFNFTEEYLYTAVVRAEDNGTPRLSSTALVNIEILDVNKVPVVNPGQSFYLDENAEAGTCVSPQSHDLDHVIAWDPDGFADQNGLTWRVEWTSVGSKRPDIPLLFDITNDGKICVANGVNSNPWYTLLNYETPTFYSTDVQSGIYQVDVIVSDRGVNGSVKNGSATVTIDLQDVNDPPRLNDSSRSTKSLSEKGSRVGSSPLNSEDQDVGEQASLQYSLLDDGSSNGLFEITPNGSVVLTREAPEVERGVDRYNLTVEVRDAHGDTDTAILTVMIVADNNAPIMHDQTLQIPENHFGIFPGGKVNFSDEDTKNSHTFFVTEWRPSIAESMVTVDEDGRIDVVGDGLFFATVPTISMDVVVEDDGIGKLTDSAVITIEVLDRPNKPTLDTNLLTVNELVPVGTLVGRITVSDPDDEEEHTFELLDVLPHHADQPNLPFTVEPNTGEVNTTSAIDVEAEWFQRGITYRHYDLNVTVTDKDGLTDNAIARIDVGDVNEPPYVGSGATSNDIFWFEIEENANNNRNPRPLHVHTSQGSNPPDFLNVLDPDSKEFSHGTLTFDIIAGDNHGVWGITAEESKPKLQLIGQLDYEDIDFYDLTILVSDGGEPPLCINVTAIVMVNDIDDIRIESFNVSSAQPTTGGEMLHITGQNLGPTGRKLEHRGALPTDVIVSGGIGRDVGEQWMVEFESDYCEIIIANTEMICRIPPGIGSQIKWRFDVDDSATLPATPTSDDAEVPSSGAELVKPTEEWITLPSDFHYQAPVLRGIYAEVSSLQGLSTAGGERLIIVGENFGPVSNSSKDIVVEVEIVSKFVEALKKPDSTVGEKEKKVSFSGVHCHISIPHVEIQCESPAGVGESLRYKLKIGEDEMGNNEAAASVSMEGSLSDADTLEDLKKDSAVSVTEASRYAPPIVRQVELPTSGGLRMDTRGGEVIRLMGDNFGDIGTSVFAFAVQFEVSSDSWDSTGEASFGAGWINLQSPVLSVAASNCEVEAGHKQIKCETAEGVGTGYVWHVLVGGQQSSINHLSNGSSIPFHVLENITTAYRSPQISGIEGPGVKNADTAGGQTVRIIGDAFGPPTTNQPKYEEYEGDYDNFDLWRYALFDIRHQLEMLFEVRIFFGREETLSDGRYPTSSSGNDALFIPNAASDAKFELKNCVVVSHSRIECETPEGVGRDFVYVMRVGNQESEVYYGVQNSSSYHPPIVSFYRSLGEEAALSFVPFATSGGEAILIEGRHFGAKTENIDRVVYGDSSTERKMITSYDGQEIMIGGFEEFEANDCIITKPHEEVVCLTAPGTGTRLTWTLFIDGQRSVAPSTSYELPVIRSIDGDGSQMASTFGGEEVTITGTGFGPPSGFVWQDPRTNSRTYNHTFLEWVKYGPTGEEYTADGCRVLNHSTIKCFTVTGSGVNHVWKAKVEGQVGPASTLRWSYATPAIYSISPDSGPTDGAILVTVIGKHFATTDPKTTAFIRFAQWNRWIPTRNHRVITIDEEYFEQMQFALPAGAGVNRSVEVVLAMKDTSFGTNSDPVFSNVVYFSYEHPVPIAMERKDAGSEWRVLLKGKNFGSCPAVGMVSKNNAMLPKEPIVREGNRIRSWSHSVIELMLHDVEGEFNVLTARVVSPGHPNRGFPPLFPTGGRHNHDNEEGLFYESEEIQLQAVQPSFQEGHPFDRNPPTLPTRGGMVISFPIFDVRNDSQETKVNIGQPQIFAIVEGIRTPILPRERDTSCELLKNSPRIVDKANNEYEIVCLTPEGQGFDVDMTVTLNHQTSAPMRVSYARPTILGIAAIGFKTYDVPQERMNVIDSSFSDLITEDGVPFAGSDYHEVMKRNPNAERTVAFSETDLGISVSLKNDGDTLVAELPTFGGLIMLCGDNFGMTGFFQGFSTPDHPYGDALSSGNMEESLRDPQVPETWSFNVSQHGVFIGNTSMFSTWTHSGTETAQFVEPAEINESVTSPHSHELSAVKIPPGVMHDSSQLSSEDVIAASQYNVHDEIFGYVGANAVGPVTADFVLRQNAESPTYSIQFFAGDPRLAHFDNAESLQSLRIRYARPKLIPQTLNSPTTGGQLLVIRGLNFGNSLVTHPRVYVGGRRCRLLFKKSSIPGEGKTLMTRAEPDPHSTIFCIAPEGSGRNQKVRVDVGIQESLSSEAMVNYDPPVVHSVSPSIGPTKGNITVRVLGENFGASPDEEVPIILTANVSDAPLWENPHVEVKRSSIMFWNHSLIEFSLPEGQGEPKAVNVIISGQSSLHANEDPVLFEYEGPRINEISRQCPTQGCSVTIFGENFGKPICRPSGDQCFPIEPVEVGIPSMATDWQSLDQFSVDDIVLENVKCKRPTEVPLNRSHSHSSITCELPESFGRNLPLSVKVGTKTSNTLRISYQAASISSFSPNTPNAVSEEKLRIRGDNFGLEGPPINITIGNVQCENPKMLTPHKQLTCDMQEDTVGPKRISVWVALQRNTFPASERLIAYECVEGYYGQPGELCLKCPEGAICERPRCQRYNEDNSMVCEEYNEPVAAEGFWRTYVPTKGGPRNGSSLAAKGDITEDSNLCVQERLSRPGKWAGSCPVFVACSPKEACVGNNQCAEPYSGHRCRECADGFFRMDGKCRTCPSQPILLLCAFIVGVIAAAAMGYHLNKKQINLAFVMIGIDYFQVLAMFARSDVEWPRYVRDFFSALSVFNLNVDLAAPECSMNVGFAMKWAAVMILPVGIMSIFLVIHVLSYLNKALIRNVPSSKRNAHLPVLIGASITTLYILYFQLTRTSFDVFNCGPTDPPDGYPHGYMQAVFKPCFKPGGLHLKLFPWAIVTTVVYVIGFPVFVMRTLKKNKKIVKIDQYLRTQGFGGQKYLSNEECYPFRKKYQKLYYNFKPGKWYWIGLILLRKFGISLTALMFQQTPAFQMALAMLILFGSFALHVKHLPYMSTAEYHSQWLYHQQRVKAGDAKHMMMHSELKDVFRKTEQLKRARKNDMKSIINKHREGPTSSFTNHNTVESVLLGSAMLVSLAGVMFQSRQLRDGENEGGRTALASMTILIIVVSLLYFGVVVFAELSSGLCPQWFNRYCKIMTKKKSTIELEEEQKKLLGDNDVDAGTSVNPMMTMGSSSLAGKDKELDEDIKNQIVEQLSDTEPPSALMWRSIKTYLNTLQEDTSSLNKDLRRLRQRRSLDKKPSSPQVSSTRPQRAARKQEFEQVGGALLSGGYVSSTATRGRGRGRGRGRNARQPNQTKIR